MIVFPMLEKEEPLSLVRHYGLSTAVVVLSIILTAHLSALSQASSLFTILGGILFSAWYGGLGPGLFTTAVSTSAITFYFMDPKGSLFIASNDDVLRLFLFVVISLTVVFFASSRQGVQARLEKDFSSFVFE